MEKGINQFNRVQIYLWSLVYMLIANRLMNLFETHAIGFSDSPLDFLLLSLLYH